MCPGVVAFGEVEGQTNSASTAINSNPHTSSYLQAIYFTRQLISALPPQLLQGTGATGDSRYATHAALGTAHNDNTPISGSPATHAATGTAHYDDTPLSGGGAQGGQAPTLVQRAQVWHICSWLRDQQEVACCSL